MCCGGNASAILEDKALHVGSRVERTGLAGDLKVSCQQMAGLYSRDAPLHWPPLSPA